jgi:DNA-binding beta-propeller fold protein YncE
MARYSQAFILAVITLISASPALAAVLLVANKSAATLNLVALPALTVVATLPTGVGPHEVEVSPDGARALVTNYGNSEAPGNTLTLVDIANTAVAATIELPDNARPHGLQWLDNNRAVVTAEGIRSLLVVDVAARAVSQRLPVDQDVAHMVALASDGARAFVANIGSGTVSVVDLVGGSAPRHIASGKGTEGIAMVNDGKELWLTNRGDGTVTIFDAVTMDRIGSAVATGFPIRAETDDARQRVYISAPADDALLVIGTDSREEIARIPFADIGPDRERETMLGSALPDSSIPVGVQLSGDGRLLFVAHTNAHVVSVYDAESLEREAIVEVGLEPDGMAWSPLTLPRAETALGPKQP